MSTHVINIIEYEMRSPVVKAVRAALRAPTSETGVGGMLTLEWTPDLTAQETTTLYEAVRTALMTPIQQPSVEADLAAMRLFRQRSQSEFMALNATQRDRELFDVINAQTNVIRALLRD